MRKFDAILMQLPESDGPTTYEIIEMLHQLNADPDEEVEPLRIEGNHVWAFGFIRSNFADILLDFKTGNDSEFGKQVISVLDDVTLENPNEIYQFAGVRTKLICGWEEQTCYWHKDKKTFLPNAP